MKFIVFSLTLLLLFVTISPAQADAAKNGGWTNIENGEFAVSLPSDHLVLVETDPHERKTVSAFRNGVNMEFSYLRQPDSKSNLGRIEHDKSKTPAVLDFQFGDFRGKTITYRNDGYRQQIYFASPSAYYVLTVTARSNDLPEVEQFLQSIHLKGQPFIVDQSKKFEKPGETLSIKSLKISPQVEEAQDRKMPKFDRKIDFQPSSAFVDCATDHDTRPALIVTRLRPAFAPGFIGGKMDGELKVKLSLRADGTIGEVTVYSDMKKDMLNAWTSAVRNVRFVPASRAGVPVDACMVVPIRFGAYSTMRVFSTE